MSEDKKKKPDDDFDIFVANLVYPEAAPIFSSRPKALDEIKNDCFVVLDTNSLLVPYNIGKESLEQIRCTYRVLTARKRLIVPGQVAREFAKNRASKIVELFQQLNRKASSVPRLQKGKYPLLESLEEYQQTLHLEEKIDAILDEYRGAITRVLDRIRGWTWDDPVSLMYGELFDQDVVFDPPIAKEQVQAELFRRQVHSIPPGYKDAGKGDSGVGDLLIWYTILELGKARKANIIFVSGDEKADWRYRSEGRPLYPRYELVDEFRRYSEGQSFHIVEFSRFLDLYGASEDVVQEVREREQSSQAELLYGLGDTEIEILELCQKGMQTREIADSLELSEGTVRNYLSSIYDKLAVRSRIEAIQKATEVGLLKPVEKNPDEISAIQNAMGQDLVTTLIGLTPREVEILELVQQGLQSKEIAEKIGVSDGTVRNNLTSVYGKLGANNRVDAIQRAQTLGVLKPIE